MIPTAAKVPPSRHVLAFCIALTSFGCGRTEPPVQGAEPVSSVQAYVSGPAAADLDEHGRFRTAGQPGAKMQGISPGRARQIAKAYAERFGSGLRGPLFREHGGAIDFATLEAAPRVYFADTPYDTVPSSAPPGIKKRFGAYYLVHLYQTAQPALAAAVSVSSEKFKEDEQGIIRFVELVGNDVFLFGLRGDEPISFPISPEEAVAISHGVTTLKAMEVPELVLEPATMSPFSARWRVVLERSTKLSGTDNRDYVTQQVYVGHKRTLSVGVAEDGNAANLRGDRPSQMPFRRGMPMRYVDVSPPAQLRPR